MYRPACLDSLPPEIADSLLEMALGRTGIVREQLDSLTADEKSRLDADAWKLVTAEIIPDTPCGH